MMAACIISFLLIIPAVSAAGGLFLGSRYPNLPRYLALISSGLVLLLSLIMAIGASQTIIFGWPWFDLGRVHARFSIEYSPLSSLMALIVAFVGFAVHIFSVRYMREDTAQPRYYAALSLFVFSMLGLALSNNLLMLFIFWELVGFGSYMLIGHYGTREAGLAADKAFLVNRIGDIFFLLGIVFVVCQMGTLDMSVLAVSHTALSASLSKTVALLIFAGVMTKSAQFPGHLWLPDAMAGPTPISALIHAATMVAAGVFLLCRLEFLFVPILPLIGYLGAFTALFAALCAFGKSDIKKVLAYSTISQLGFMATGFGLGSSSAAFFHLTTHAFFKALLFLSAGSILTACHHEQDACKLGGLWKRMPFTFALFLFGALALAGFPLTAGFFSKDVILTLAQTHNTLIFIVLMLSSLLTALYMGRLIGLLFLGKPESQAANQAKEEGLLYYIPLTMLAVGALIGGYCSIYPHFSAAFFAKLPAAPENYWLLAWSLLIAVAAAGVAVVYSSHKPEPLESAKGFYGVVKASFCLDKLWHQMGLWSESLSRAWACVDKQLWEGIFHRGVAGLFSQAGNFAKATYMRLLTVSLYWILSGALFFALLFAFHNR